MLNKNRRAHSNLAMLEFMVRKLGILKDDFVFLGGCATALFIDDPAVPDVRTTLDVDCIVDVISLKHYHQLEKKLTAQGFKKSITDDVICRWHYDDAILDVMPTDEKILGFGNRWYKTAIKQTLRHQIATDIFMQSVSAPYFLATKFEAFDSRGNNDYLMSHDFEDIVSIIDGRTTLINEVMSCHSELKTFLQKTFMRLLKDENFLSALPGHLLYGSSTAVRTEMVLNRIKQLAGVSGN